MVFLNWQELPWYWYGFDSFRSRCDGAAGAGPARLRVRLVRLSLRVTGVYLSIITQAMTYALLLAFFRNDMGFGGNNGLTDFKDILGFTCRRTARGRLVRGSALALALGFVICRVVTVQARQGAGRGARRRKPHPLPRLPGRALQAVRLRAVRHAWRALPARSTCRRSASSIPANSRRPTPSRAVIWVAVGGRGTLIGPSSARCWSIRQDLVHRRAAGNLAVRAGRAVYRGHPVPAQGHRRHDSQAGAPCVTSMSPRGAGGDDAGGHRNRRRAESQPRRRSSGCTRGRKRCSISTASRCLRRLQGAERAVAGTSSPAKCGRSSAPTAPARRP